jgi:Plavaka transposase
MSAGNIDQLMKIWASHGAEHGEKPPFLNHSDLYETIDAATIGDVPWQSFVTSYLDEIPQQGEVPPWMTAKHTVWFRDPRLLVHNILSNPDFKDMFDTSPYQEYNAKNNHRYHDFMSGNWAWRHAVCLRVIYVLISSSSIRRI